MKTIIKIIILISFFYFIMITIVFIPELIKKQNKEDKKEIYSKLLGNDK